MKTLREQLKGIKLIPSVKYGYRENGKYGKTIIGYTAINKGQAKKS